jgi:hypothetical protein
MTCEDCTCGVHGLLALQRHDDCQRFASDEEAQAYTRAALLAYDQRPTPPTKEHP